VAITCIANAVAEDNGNMAAQLAMLFTSYRTTADQRENRLFAAKLFDLLQKVPNEEGMWPLRLRLRFNLLAAFLNDAASFGRQEVRPRSDSPDIDKVTATVRDVLYGAAEQAGNLVVFWQNRENRRTFPELWQDMAEAVTFAARAIIVEWERRFSDPMVVGWAESRANDAEEKVKVTLLARYEHACTLIGQAAVPAEPPQPKLYTQALDELQMVTAVRYYRTWARSDPSLTDLHDIDKIKSTLNRVASPTDQADVKPGTAEVPTSATTRALEAEEASDPPLAASDIAYRFKRLTGDPCPADFLALSPFVGHREAMAERGIHGAAELDQTPAATLVSELGITDGIADRWREVAHLYTRLRTVPPASDHANDAAKRDEITTALVFLLMEAKLDSVPALQQELDNGLDQLRAMLLDCARPWAVVVPARDEISGWQQQFSTAGNS
jgi:hypothetical protein